MLLFNYLDTLPKLYYFAFSVPEPEPLVQWSAALPPAQMTLVCYPGLANIASVAHCVDKHVGMATIKKMTG